ncbi:hypothetical protein HNR16_001682 [Pseudoclavibacter chungangensis]|nr:hypothetical protein [Pseudoclavibacter chungangensis]
MTSSNRAGTTATTPRRNAPPTARDAIRRVQGRTGGAVGLVIVHTHTPSLPSDKPTRHGIRVGFENRRHCDAVEGSRFDHEDASSRAATDDGTLGQSGAESAAPWSRWSFVASLRRSRQALRPPTEAGFPRHAAILLPSAGNRSVQGYLEPTSTVRERKPGCCYPARGPVATTRLSSAPSMVTWAVRHRGIALVANCCRSGHRTFTRTRGRAASPPPLHDTWRHSRFHPAPSRQSPFAPPLTALNDPRVASNSVVYGSGGRVAADIATVTA